MKKLIALIVAFLTFNLYGQNYKSYNVTTKNRSTSTMIWNSNNENWDFFDNGDLESYDVEWKLVLDLTGDNGTIVGNNVTFDVKGIETKKTEDGDDMVVIRATTTRSQNDVIIILTRLSGDSLILALYDHKARKVFYYR